MTIYDSAPGKTYRLIYLTDNGARDVVVGVCEAINTETITLRTDSGQVAVIDRARILDDREVV
jgi:hypothetical protein